MYEEKCCIQREMKKVSKQCTIRIFSLKWFVLDGGFCIKSDRKTWMLKEDVRILECTHDTPRR